MPALLLRLESFGLGLAYRLGGALQRGGTRLRRAAVDRIVQRAREYVGPWLPSDEEMGVLTDLFMQADADPRGSITVARTAGA